MKEIVILILLFLIINTCLLLYQMLTKKCKNPGYNSIELDDNVISKLDKRYNWKCIPQNEKDFNYICSRIPTISFTYNIKDIHKEKKRLINKEYIYASSTLYDSDNINTRKPIGDIKGDFLYKKDEKDEKYSHTINQKFFIDEYNLILTGSPITFMSDKPDLFPFPSSWNGSLIYNDIFCGLFKMEIDEYGTRKFNFYLINNWQKMCEQPRLVSKTD